MRHQSYARRSPKWRPVSRLCHRLGNRRCKTRHRPARVRAAYRARKWMLLSTMIKLAGCLRCPERSGRPRKNDFLRSSCRCHLYTRPRSVLPKLFFFFYAPPTREGFNARRRPAPGGSGSLGTGGACLCVFPSVMITPASALPHAADW